MADLIINTPVCSTVNAGNTGVPGCYFNPKNIVGAIMVDKNATFTAAEVAVFKTTLQTAVLAAGTERVYPIFRFVEVADNSEEETIASSGYGEKEPVKDGDYDLKFRFIKGGLCLLKNLRKFNNTDMKVLLVDSDNNVFGTLNSAGELCGMTCVIYAPKMKFNDGSNASQYFIRIILNKPEEFNDAPGFVHCDFNVENEIKGNLDVELVQHEVDFGVATVKLRTACGKTDLYDTYDDEFAAVGMWTCTKAGAAVTITGVAKDATNKAWDISFTGTGVHTLNLAAPSVLAAAGIGGSPENGYEGIALEVTMPTS